MRARISRHLGPVLAGGAPPAAPPRRAAPRSGRAGPRSGSAHRRPGLPAAARAPRRAAVGAAGVQRPGLRDLPAPHRGRGRALADGPVPVRRVHPRRPGRDALEDDVRAWQETILGVAKEEMGHLITVQNLLTVLGAARQFDRDDYPNAARCTRSGSGWSHSASSRWPHTSAREPGRLHRRRSGRDQGPGEGRHRRPGQPGRRDLRRADPAVRGSRRRAGQCLPGDHARVPGGRVGSRLPRGSAGTEATSILPDLPGAGAGHPARRLAVDGTDALPRDRRAGGRPGDAGGRERLALHPVPTVYRALKDLGPGSPTSSVRPPTRAPARPRTASRTTRTPRPRSPARGPAGPTCSTSVTASC